MTNEQLQWRDEYLDYLESLDDANQDRWQERADSAETTIRRMIGQTILTPNLGWPRR